MNLLSTLFRIVINWACKFLVKILERVLKDILNDLSEKISDKCVQKLLKHENSKKMLSVKTNHRRVQKNRK